MTWYVLAVFISDKSELEKLSFKARGHHFTMAQVEWRNVILNPGACESRPVVDLSQNSFTEVLVELYGNLGLIEIFELFTACRAFSELNENLDKNQFMQKQAMVWNQRQEQLFERLAQAPQEFLDWAHNKQMSSKDLQPLLSLTELNEVSEILTALALQAPSRNEGKQILDLVVDLVLLKHSQQSLLPQPGSDWLKYLTQLRQPQASARQQQQPPSSPWPKYVQVVNYRQGDRMLKKMQITYSDRQDLQTKLQRLSSQESL